MKQLENWELVNEAGELKTLPAGAYACKITDVVDVPEKEYLDVFFDIVEGEYKGYFKNLETNTGKCYGRITRSYKQTALPFFKAFVTASEKSNPGYTWNWDEKSLIGKFVTVVFRDEEYLKDGTVKVMAKADEIRSLQALRDGFIKIKPLKKLEIKQEPEPSSVELSDDELPF